MGNCLGSTSVLNDSVDVAHALSQTERKIRLIEGYIKSTTKVQKILPDDIKSIIMTYLENMNPIKSRTDIKNEIEARQKQEEEVHHILHSILCIFCQYFININRKSHG